MSLETTETMNPFNVFSTAEKPMNGLKENLNTLHRSLASLNLIPAFIKEEIDTLFKAFEDSINHIETSFSYQKSILAEITCPADTDTLDSSEFKMKLRDKSFNSLHGAVGNIDHILENVFKLKDLLKKHQHFVPDATTDELGSIFKSLQENLKSLDESTYDQENILHKIISKPKTSLSQAIPGSFWHKKPSLSEASSGSLSASPVQMHDLPKVKVLIVDDSVINRKILGGFLKEFDCYYAVDGEEAITQYNRVKPQIVLMDITMPKKNGYEASAEIRHIEKAAKLSPSIIIAVSANVIDKQDETTISAGMNDYLAKPFKSDAIKQKITHQLSLKSTGPINNTSEIETGLQFAP